MVDPLERIAEIIQADVNQRGLARDPACNLITATRGDFQRTCQSIASHPEPVVAIVTGFLIPHATPPAGETDGPLGAVFLARALVPLGIRVAIITDFHSLEAIRAGLQECGLADRNCCLDDRVVTRSIPGPSHPWSAWLQIDWSNFQKGLPLTHLIALERPGPSHSVESIRAQNGTVPQAFLDDGHTEHHDRCHTMGGQDISDQVGPAHFLFEAVNDLAIDTIGIGDGGNEIGMGKVPWEVIRNNVPRGGLVACRVPTHHLIVAGVSNWGAYGLGQGVRLLRGAGPDPRLFDPGEEKRILQVMVERGPLVDGMTGKPTATVDGLSFDRYAEVLVKIGQIR